MTVYSPFRLKPLSSWLSVIMFYPGQNPVTRELCKSNSLCPQPAPAEWLMSNVVGKTWHLRQAAASHVLTPAPVLIICCCLLSQFICHISSIQSKVQIIKWIKKYKWPSVWFKHQKILFLMLYRDLPWCENSTCWDWSNLNIIKLQ